MSWPSELVRALRLPEPRPVARARGISVWLGRRASGAADATKVSPGLVAVTRKLRGAWAGEVDSDVTGSAGPGPGPGSE